MLLKEVPVVKRISVWFRDVDNLPTEEVKNILVSDAVCYISQRLCLSMGILATRVRCSAVWTVLRIKRWLKGNVGLHVGDVNRSVDPVSKLKKGSGRDKLPSWNSLNVTEGMALKYVYIYICVYLINIWDKNLDLSRMMRPRGNSRQMARAFWY